jgi:hypothetical protein
LLKLCFVDSLCAGSSPLPYDDAEGSYQWEVQTPDSWAFYWETPYALTAPEGGILGQGVALVLSSVSLPLFMLIFVANSVVSNLEPNL